MDNLNPVSAGVPAPAPGAAPGVAKLRDRKGRPYQPAVGPRLRVLLVVIFAAVALLGATGVYLAAIRVLEWGPTSYTNSYTIGVFMGHVLTGVALILPFLLFGLVHLATARRRPNRVAVRLGIILFIVGILTCVTGLALIQLEGLPQLPTNTWGRNLMLALHYLTPIAAVWLYVLHRRAGPEIKWQWGYAWGGTVAVAVAAMVALHLLKPHDWYRKGSHEGEKYFEPSAARTRDGKFISARALMMDDYCLKCHKDIYNGWFHSAHHFSSFNNPAYLFSVRETRKVSLARDGNTRPSRWCAGCHDVVPFFSGAFDDPNYDDVSHPTAHAGITCTACHAITNIDSTAGNAAYTIDEPEHYPFATSDNPFLQWLNNQAVKAKPDFHKKTFLKPFHRTAEFCSTCHKVSVPMALNHYKEFLRGQDHHDSFELSGAGHGARSFYYPPAAQMNCNGCHMPLRESTDFGARDFDNSGRRKVHDHIFLGGNTGLPALVLADRERLPNFQKYERNSAGLAHAIDRQADFLKNKQLRIDLFGLREEAAIDGRLYAPLRPELPSLKPGRSYLVEVVIRTLGLGHHFSQGTVDSNEIWVDFQARDLEQPAAPGRTRLRGGKVIGRSGGLSGPDDTGTVDEWAHFVNVLMLDRNGHRINRRNPQDIFTPLYDHQIPPGAGQVVHYQLDVPPDVRGPVELKVRLRYRKFDFEYMALVHEVIKPDDPEEVKRQKLNDPQTLKKIPKLPVVDICEDRVVLPVAGQDADVPEQKPPIEPAWQRWNDYGIGLFLTASGDPKKPGLRQAEEAFQKLLDLGDKGSPADAYLNLARVYLADSGRYKDAGEALKHATTGPWWVRAWLRGLVKVQAEDLDGASADFRKILDPKGQPAGFDFTGDYVVRNELARTLFTRAQQEGGDRQGRDDFLRRAVEEFERTLASESEDLEAHYGLKQCYELLGEEVAETVNLPAGKVAPPEEPELRQRLQDLAAVLADGKQTPEARRRAAAELGAAVEDFGHRPTDPERPKLPVLQALREQCRKLYLDRGDPQMQTAAAHVLGEVHRAMHAIYKPDENAKDRTVALYRATHPAAREASQALVIYRLR
jgi:tetratricopeptide (TPR) repeat protein